MERKIEFRGKIHQTDMWVFGSLVIRPDGEHNIFAPVEKDPSRLVDWNVIPSTVGQFTGVTDCNGTPIFEGDILRHQHTVNTGVLFTDLFEVRWHPEFSGFYCVCIDGGSVGVEENLDGYCDFTVVGNIHDNPLPTNGNKQ